MPLATILGGGVYYGVKTGKFSKNKKTLTFKIIFIGFFKPNPRFGAAPKVISAIVVGYFVGKFSYQTKCAEKLMQLPNSQIGEMLRQKRRGNLQERYFFNLKIIIEMNICTF